MFALKLAKEVGLKGILSSSSGQQLKTVCEQSPKPPILTVNYGNNPSWHEEILKHTNGGTGTLLKSMKCTRGGGIIIQVLYLVRKKFDGAPEILTTLIDRRIILRYIFFLGSMLEMNDLSTALTATKIKFDDMIDSAWAFDNADKALQ